MLSRIVVGTDGSETAALAVSRAQEIAAALGAALEIVSAYQAAEPRSAAAAYEPGIERPAEAQEGLPADVPRAVGPRAQATAILERATAEARAAGVERVGAHAVEGEPADAIIGVAEQTGAKLIVVGNKGMTGARRFLLGSVPNKISHHAPCDVYIVRTT